MRIALLSNVTVEVLAGMLKKEHALWTPPGFGAWMETSLRIPDDLRAFGPEVVFLLLDESHGVVDSANVARAVASLELQLPAAEVVALDLADLADEVGSFYDDRMWKLGSMPWSMLGLRAIKDEIARLLALMRGGRKKALAVDFDNTLWRGVVGEDGAAGVEPHAAFQSGLKALQKRGVLLVGLSRNNAADVEPLWDDPRMVLKRDDFVDLRIDWNDKAANLTASAQALNLGTEAFVFVDDNPVERAQMRAFHPEVAVPDFDGFGVSPSMDASVSGDGCLRFLRRLSRLYFPAFRVTDEDRDKTKQYRAEFQRQALASSSSFDDYLKSLEIWTDVHLAREAEVPRVAQLSQKTNQFNVRTNRYTADEVSRFLTASNHLVWTVRAGDKFGDQGLVAFVHVELDGAVARIFDWVMSCRTMNRRLEFSVEDVVERALQERGVKALRAEWRRSAKNEPVRELFERFGFECVKTEADGKWYEKVLG